MQHGGTTGGVAEQRHAAGRGEHGIEVIANLICRSGTVGADGKSAQPGHQRFDHHDRYACDELSCYDRTFKIQDSYRNRYLKHCHEIYRMEQTIFLTSTGFDSLLAFYLEEKKHLCDFHLQRHDNHWTGHTFDPRTALGPRPVNDFHINMVHVDGTGIYLSGLGTDALLHLNRKFEVSEVCNLPTGVRNTRTYRDGVLFDDTASDCVRYVDRDGRDRFVAGGSSPSTISLYDLQTNQKVGSVNLTMDIRNAIHGLEPWPYDD